jgi:myosin-7
MRAAAVVIQKNFRAYHGRKKYQQMRTGYMRLQALVRSRALSHKFRHLRGNIVRLQARYVKCHTKSIKNKKVQQKNSI